MNGCEDIMLTFLNSLKNIYSPKTKDLILLLYKKKLP